MTDGRTCPRCTRTLTVLAYGKDKSRSDGLAVWCMECRSTDMRSRRAAGKEPPLYQFWYQRNPAMTKARVAVQRAIKSGDLAKPSICPACNTLGRKVEGHHHLGYAPEHWLDVVWRCRSCHKLEHTRAA